MASPPPPEEVDMVLEEDPGSGLNYTCTGSTEDQLEAFDRFNFWIDGVLKPLICMVSKKTAKKNHEVLFSAICEDLYKGILADFP